MNLELGPIFRGMLRNKIGFGLLVFEIAITLAIGLNCVTMVKREIERVGKESGLDEENLIAISINPFGTAFEESSYRQQVVADDMALLRARPEIRDAVLVSPFPLQGGGSSLQAKPLGAPDTALVRAPRYIGGSHMVETFGLSIAEGRDFTEADVLRTSDLPEQLNVLVTRDLADALYPDGNGLGKQVDIQIEGLACTIVGIVDYMYTPYDNGGPMETRIIFFPGLRTSAGFSSYLVRTEPGHRDTTIAALNDLLLAKYPDRVLRIRSVESMKETAYFFNRFVIIVLSSVVVLLVLVTAIGLLGMTWFSVARRTHQIGVRRALGATRVAILRFFFVENSLVTVLGMTLGLALAIGLNRILIVQTSGQPLTPILVLISLVFLWSIGLAATLWPAWRGSRIEPAIASRNV
ncbi:ABC transporter permease [Sulfidibacter corallicola]|uniref:ABC transporter permease n=1 Tax=Sulfidibacter corallicola TaxID=2818388 RepID=A0A8A4TEE2_SULCO|nr:FtsX-like permease family protein [Sulfidibacter corallicola]QTD48326.1 ABC transporter permease [Sulfidibacter corallicola]